MVEPCNMWRCDYNLVKEEICSLENPEIHRPTNACKSARFYRGREFIGKKRSASDPCNSLIR
jgi:hypothetical protein